MRFIIAMLALLATTSVRAETVVLELSADERAALIAVIGAALQAQPQQARAAAYLLNKINNAPVEAPTKTQETPNPGKPEDTK